MPVQLSSSFSPLLSRRSALRALGAIGLGAYLGGNRSVFAEAPRVIAPPVAHYPFKIGALEAIAISDGVLKISPPFPKLAANGTEEKVAELLRADRLPTHTVTLNINILLLRIGNEVILFDTGYGPGVGPSTGWLPNNLRTLGIAPEEITSILLSHAHLDHYGGLFNAVEELVYPNAKLFINPVELDFWLGDAPDLSKCAADAAFKQKQIERNKKALMPIRAKMEVMKPGDRLFGAIEVLEAPGHTPGHVNYKIQSGDEVLHHMVDLAHSYALGVRQPDWYTVFDVWPEVAVATHHRFFGELSQTQTRLFAYHFPFPGIGRIGPEGEGFRWLPEAWSWPAVS